MQYLNLYLRIVPFRNILLQPILLRICRQTIEDRPACRGDSQALRRGSADNQLRQTHATRTGRRKSRVEGGRVEGGRVVSESRAGQRRVGGKRGQEAAIRRKSQEAAIRRKSNEAEERKEKNG